MGNNDLSNSEKILVKVDQNNLVYIDPNSVVQNGEVQPRGIKQENLVMYVNLEADLVPRSTFVSDGDKTTFSSVAKGTLNFLSSQTEERDLTSAWTNSYLTKKPHPSKDQTFYQSDETGESFGIESVTISVKGANFVPQVNINFIDVRGKTLFESPENSPYKAFFHLPWPIFYLTVKGYYGKAIRYKLHLVKFNSRYNEQNGNFEISTSFVGSTFAFMNDIPLKGILNAPYMFMNESEKQGTFNEKTGKIEKKVFKSSKGYSILSSVYAEMKRKKLIPQNFPVKTIREVAEIAETLDRILEQQIFGGAIDMKVLVGLQDYDKVLTNFETKLKSWGTKYLNPTLNRPDGQGENQLTYFGLKDPQKFNLTSITGSTSPDTLEGIITVFSGELKKSELLNNDLQKDKSIQFDNRFLTKSLSSVGNYYKIFDNGVYVAQEKLINDLREIRKTFYEQKQKVEREVERKMNEVVKSDMGIGFEPTVRNLFAVILANAEVYVRLMKEVHQDAFKVSDTRKKLLFGLSPESKGDPIYPWPEIKKTTPSDKKKIIAYPGEPELRKKLQSDNPVLWPEVGFIEEYISIATNRVDPLADKEGGVNNIDYIFESDFDESRINETSSLFDVSRVLPYSDRSLVSFVYELYERSKLLTLVDSATNETIKELVNVEFDTIKELIKDESDLVDILKTSIKNIDDLRNVMRSYSQFERWPYYLDSIPTQEYLKDLLEQPFSIEQYTVKNTSNTKDTSKPKDTTQYTVLNSDLVEYVPEQYRSNIYPFNSSTYLSYLKLNDFKSTNLTYKGVLQVRPEKGFICSTVSPYSWVKEGFRQTMIGTNTLSANLFTNNLKFKDFNENILNTPYFHKQLYSDFNKNSSGGKYVGSAYLLLNSLPFLDLDDKISLPKEDQLVLNKGVEYHPPILMSTLFREQSSTHFIPYHLMLKWGSIYHRYKTQILEGKDILDGFITNGVTTNIDTSLFFNSGKTENGFTQFSNGLPTAFSGATSTGGVDVGIHPFYDAIFHQIINGYNHYNVLQGDNSYFTNVTKGAIKTRWVNPGNGLRYWTSFVDNSKFDSRDNRYTVLPSTGDNKKLNQTNIGNVVSNANETYQKSNQINYRTIWGDNYINSDYSGLTFFNTDEYNKTITNGDYSLNGNKRKVLDLIATFSPKILDQFEDLFLEFASEKIKEEVPYKKYTGLKYDNFQDLLREVMSVEKVSDDNNLSTDEVINKIKLRQSQKLTLISGDILGSNNILKLKLGNPKELDPYIIEGFIDIAQNTLSYNAFNNNQLVNQKYIDLYVGLDIDGYYLEFFRVNNIELSEENVLRFRPLILIYGGYRKSGQPDTSTSFKEYIRNNIFTPANNRFTIYLTQILYKLINLKKQEDSTVIDFVDGYNNRNLKVELYNFFKSFNDKWSSGNSIGQRLLMEEFLFLDKANKDIGDKTFLNLDRFISITSQKNDKASLYSALSMLIQGSGFDMRTLPAYVNFYGNNIQSSSKIVPSEKVAQNVFGTFLEVDYQESSPKTVIQFVGPSSKHPSDMDKKYKFGDDSFDLSKTNDNPLIITLPQTFNTDYLNKSNKVVAFEVSFGDQNQSIFKGVTLDQSTIKNTSESFVVLENLARSESGAGTYNVDVGLFDYYRQVSYSCEVTCMGNVMIQPTMFFYLKNIPMFRGSYWITEVSHSIRNNNIVTTFKGSRIPQTALPDPEDSFMSSYKALFDKILSKARANVNSQNTSSTEIVVKTDRGSFKTDPGSVIVKGETPLTSEVGITSFGVPYNGEKDEKYIQKVSYGNKNWLRAVVARMGSSIYQIQDDTQMSIIPRLSNSYIVKDSQGNKKLTWGELKEYGKSQKFYSTKFQFDTASADKIVSGKTNFLNPKNGKEVSLTPTYSLDRSINSNNFKVEGPVNVGPNINGYGIGMSEALMKELDLYEGQVVYFELV